MKKELKGVLYLYLGCDIAVEYDSTSNAGMHIDTLDWIGENTCLDTNGCSYNFKQVKPILRKLTDITAEEKETASKLSGLVALGTANIGEKNLIYSEAEHIAYLLKQGFDLFGLIESGQALDKKTL